MTRGIIEIPAEMQPSKLELSIQRRHDLSERYGNLNEQIQEALHAYTTERAVIKSWSDWHKRNEAMISLSAQLDLKLQPLRREKDRIRKELAELALFIKIENVRKEEAKSLSNQARLKRHEEYMAHLQSMMDLPEGDVRALVAKSLTALRRLKDQSLLLPEECSLIPLLDQFVRRQKVEN